MLQHMKEDRVDKITMFSSFLFHPILVPKLDFNQDWLVTDLSQLYYSDKAVLKAQSHRSGCISVMENG